MVGPFIFFDQMGPAEFLLGQGMDVRPHPHIGLSTVTYLFAGEVMHRDSLGTELATDLRRTGSKLFGIQSWVALSAKDEETAPDFAHYEASALPVIDEPGQTVRIIAGTLFGAASPVRTSSPMFYADVALAMGAAVPLDADHEERAIYTVSGTIDIAGDVFGPGRLLVFRPGDRITIRARADARFLMLGGEPMDGPRLIWWNFVSSRKDRIEQAKADWRAGKFDSVPGDSEFIPLPDRLPGDRPVGQP